MEVWLTAENGLFSRVEGVCCIDTGVSAEYGSCGDVRVRDAVEGIV
jgi:hypothetical protein